MEVAALAVILIFSVFVTFYGYEIFLDSFERGRTTGTMLDMKAWIPEAAIPAGFVLLSLSCVVNIWRALSGDLPEDEEVME